MKNKKQNIGFTLIELLVVISIIGILIGLSIFGLQGARETSRDAKRKSDLEQIRSGIEIYKADCNAYPATLSPGSPLTGDGSTPSCLTTNTYISSVPVDASSPSHDYNYSSDGITYTVCASLEQAPNPPFDSNGPIKNCTGCGSGNEVSCNYVVTNP